MKMEVNATISFDVCPFSLVFFTFASAFARCERALILQLFLLGWGIVMQWDKLLTILTTEFVIKSATEGSNLRKAALISSN